MGSDDPRGSDAACDRIHLFPCGASAVHLLVARSEARPRHDLRQPRFPSHRFEDPQRGGGQPGRLSADGRLYQPVRRGGRGGNRGRDWIALPLRHRRARGDAQLHPDRRPDRDDRRARAGRNRRRAEPRGGRTPDGVRNQIEGAILQSSSWTLYESVTFEIIADLDSSTETEHDGKHFIVRSAPRSSASFRSQWGAKQYADIRAVIETGRRQSIGALQAIRNALAAPIDAALSAAG